MTWRERIVRAKARRHRLLRVAVAGWYTGLNRFTREDEERARSTTTCAAAELMDRFGLFFSGDLFPIGTRLHKAILYDDVETAERLLDKMEDVALQLKREGKWA